MSRGIIINNPGYIETVVNLTTIKALDDDTIYTGSVWLSNISSDEILAVKRAIEAYSPGGGGDDRYDEGYAAGTNDTKHAIAVDHQPIAEEYQTLLPGVAAIQAQDPKNLIGQRNIFNLAADYLSEGGSEGWHSSNPLCFTAEQANSTVKSANNRLVKPEISYDGVNWSAYTEGTTITLTNIGDKVYFRSKMVGYAGTQPAFNLNGKIALSGNPESLIEVCDGALYGYCFASVFYNASALINAHDLELPSTVLRPYCYENMFQGCTSLITAPELPATTLADYCYASMFQGCKSLTTSPELPATTLADYCYYYMFRNCTSLITAPELPATTLADYCYFYMFHGCTSLITAPELPATTLANSCYFYMFGNCDSLITAPALPATTLANSCYASMFQGCTSLITAPELPAPAVNVVSCYRNTFNGCSNLNSIKVGATTWGTSYTTNWVSGVSSTGTFYKKTGVSIPTGTGGIPSGWTVVEYD